MLWIMLTIILMITVQTEQKILIVFDDIIADVKTSKKFRYMVEDLFFGCRKLNAVLFSSFKGCQIKFYTLSKKINS